MEDHLRGYYARGVDQRLNESGDCRASDQQVGFGISYVVGHSGLGLVLPECYQEGVSAAGKCRICGFWWGQKNCAEAAVQYYVVVYQCTMGACSVFGTASSFNIIF
jgi:hypothetical protein